MNSCAGCGLEIAKAFAGGIWIQPDGTLIEYLLCRSCVAERERDPQAVMAKVELRLGKNEARA